ncbi:MAG: PKD domain-containing protein [Crocinitomicaceae bacterium]
MILNKQSLYFLIFSFTFLIACKKEDATPPSANFLAYNVSCIAPCEVYFFDESERAVSWSWNFGNGQTSSKKDDTITFQHAGNYEVKLEVTAENGVADSKIKWITILSADTMFVSNVELLQYKTLTTSWTSWDVDEHVGEDFYIDIKENGNLIYSGDTVAFSNKSSADLPLAFILNRSLAEDQGTYEILLYDKDTLSANDFLGSVSFSPLDYNNATNINPPNQITLESISDSLIVRLNVSWLN